MASAASSVLSRFHLVRPRLVGSLPASSRNDNLLVEDSLGGRYVLRRYRRNPQRERIEFQLSFQQHLFRRGFPTSRVIETVDRERVVVLGRDFWVLFTHVEGAEYDYRSEGQAREAGRWLSQFHSACEDVQSPEELSDTIPDVRRWWLDGEGELIRLEEMFGHGTEAEVEFLRAWHVQLLSAWPLVTLDTLPAVWVHGDYHGRNMVFTGDRLAGLFDFDVIHRGFRIEDVALGIFAFGREHRESDRIRAETARIFLDEYDKALRLTELERRALPMMAVVVQARTAARYALRQSGGDDPVRLLRTHVGRMRAVQAQMTTLGPTLLESR